MAIKKLDNYPDRDELLSPKEAAKLLPSTSAQTLARWAKRGDVPAIVLPSGRRFFRREDVEALLTPTTESADEAAQNESSNPLHPDDFLPGLEEMGS